MPLLSLGIPANAVMGVILGALLIQGITPGPTLVANRPDIFFGVIASMLIGNLMLIVLNVPLISLFVQLLRLPGSILAPLIIVFCVIGAYTLSNNVVEVIIMIGFGIAGYLMRKVDLDPAPLVLAFVLGNIFETNFRQALLVGKGTLSLFYTRPIAALLMACCVALIARRRLAPRRSMARPSAKAARRLACARSRSTTFCRQPLLVQTGCPHYREPCPISRPPHRPMCSPPGHRRARGESRLRVIARTAFPFLVVGAAVGNHGASRHLSAQAVSAAGGGRRRLRAPHRRGHPAASRARHAHPPRSPASRSPRSSASPSALPWGVRAGRKTSSCRW